MNEAVTFCYELIACNHDLCRWLYDSGGRLLETTRETPRLFHTLFTHFKSIDAMLAHGREHSTPMLLSMPIGLYAIAVFEKVDGNLKQVHVLGPAFSTDVPIRVIDERIGALTSQPEERIALKNVLYTLPLVAPQALNQYGQMLHYAITGERLAISDIVPQADARADMMETTSHTAVDGHAAWLAEQSILRMVREGNLAYASVLADGQAALMGRRLKTSEPLRQAKVGSEVFAALCARAAIEGGALADKAYLIADGYIQSIEHSTSGVGINALVRTMVEEFIREVRKAQASAGYSKAVRACIDYIDSHVESEWGMPQLAQHVGYTPYYLSAKFKRETGMTIGDYNRKAKVRQAKVLLTGSSLSVLEISERLHFSSRSFFSDTFAKEAGMTPVEYRKKGTPRGCPPPGPPASGRIGP